MMTMKAPAHRCSTRLSGRPQRLLWATLLGLGLLAGCATPPMEQPPRETVPARERETPQATEETPPAADDEAMRPSHRRRGTDLPPAARTLVLQADQALARGDADLAIIHLERAQRVAPQAAAVYLKLAEAYVRKEALGRAEQFALKGLAQAGEDRSLRRAGWQLLSDIRRARGDLAGARRAEQRGQAL